MLPHPASTLTAYETLLADVLLDDLENSWHQLRALLRGIYTRSMSSTDPARGSKKCKSSLQHSLITTTRLRQRVLRSKSPAAISALRRPLKPLTRSEIISRSIPYTGSIPTKRGRIFKSHRAKHATPIHKMMSAHHHPPQLRSQKSKLQNIRLTSEIWEDTI